ncbi:TPA: hypothetical protein DCP77_00875 [Candidatus Collierbacteria bacterium]|uniref:PilT protein domain protein n=1 Tax=Candidatus Collierbacteria bacterium GW2011_GWA2_42_17 TaxID=1618378 RepID=A0A0G1BZK9_9BACT|nr:MAG: PilT protein domain protein [Candidatus Collierbacteria bacterium GW2011_GWB2_42_12]KKS42878.1 MAG: PilT protein domain protein [Candidatus Collierbacteria bacterium GW2011_GWA2_42_17]KKS62988.1 MAG: PilT protein domain protein [Candidatus Collierbacteria bacterium GW2011_GWE2_42_48]KKS63274.1 MAG: PilT protein domain protein [Candidatus Collierbacteria bacterium GW2011_GWD2_42_50]KKS63316.1 MAG: PilT protein domain protein [Candidatus Collierbacteria bacterium GW2011_GWF1_42_50]KKS644
MAKISVFDTNAILRYLLRDNEDQYLVVQKELLKIRKNSGTVVVIGEVVMECVYVLETVYRATRVDIAEKLKAFLISDIVLQENNQVILATLERYASVKLSYVDCLILEKTKELGAKLFTFDKKLSSFVISEI